MLKSQKQIWSLKEAMNTIHSEKTSGDVKKSKDIDGVLMRP